MRQLFRFFFASVLFGSIVTWVYFSYVTASQREAILIEDRYVGIDKDDIVYPSTSHFVFRRIVPGRIRLHRLHVYPRFLRIHFKKGLEQAEGLGLDSSFYIQAILRLHYKLNPEKLLYLFRKLEKPNWNMLENYLSQSLQNFLEERVSGFYKADSGLSELKLKMKLYFEEKARDELNQAFQREGVEFYSLTVKHIYVPDRKRYEAILSSDRQIINQKLNRIRIISKARAEKDAATIHDEAYFVRLEKIGKLLNTYPHLQNYIAIDRLAPNVEVMVVPHDRWFSNSFRASPIPKKSYGGHGNKDDRDKKSKKMNIMDFIPFSSGYSSEKTEKSFRSSGKTSREVDTTMDGTGPFSDLTPP